MNNLKRGTNLLLKAHKGLFQISEFRNHEYSVGVARPDTPAETAFFVREDEIDKVVASSQITD